jgi:hypothetical protein
MYVSEHDEGGANTNVRLTCRCKPSTNVGGSGIISILRGPGEYWNRITAG